ncbi:MAG: translation initiation factor IF-2 [Hyphomicrobium sp.]|jgi:translation initiation factor IF-2|nr:translation initiation factor IF-2 [Hyphomicrobium sp.]
MDTKDTTDKTARPGAAGTTGSGGAAGAGTRKPLSLQRTVESGHVRQNFSHGRSKPVIVEKRKTRKLGATEAPAPATPAPVSVKPAPTPASEPRPAAAERTEAGRTLRPEERDARARALAEARRLSEIEDSQRAERGQTEAAAPAAEISTPPPAPAATTVVAPQPAAPVAAAPASAPAEARAPSTTSQPPLRRDATAPRSEQAGNRPSGRYEGRAGARPSGQGYNTAFMPREGGRPKEINIPVARPAAPAERAPIEPPKGKEIRTEPRVREEMTEDEETRVIKRGGKIVRTPVKTAPEPQKERVKLTINNAFDQEQRERSLASLKRKRERERLKAMGVQQPRDKIVREVIIPEAITIQELSNRMAERAVDLIKLLMKQGAMHKITDVIDADTAELIVQEFGHTAKRVSESDVETGFIGDKDDDQNLRARAPVVTIMGHVDHGKTSLLDAIRQTNVVSGEAGGITQHIGAYQVALPSGDRITFIDTPGHAAFTAMRARGAKVTDIVVLVVAADDGVMPQTVEAINHAKAAGVPMIVAINKVDKPQADPNRVKTDLLSHEVVVESMGGDTLEVPVSALKRTNLDKLLEAIHLQAEVLDLKANPDRTAEGIVIEAKLERGRGPVGTALVQRGTLHVGDIVVAGTAWGRVRALINDKGQNIAEAGPSVPVEILGFDSAPEAGDQVAVVENEARAREITDYRIRKRRETLGAAGSKSTLEQMMQQLKEAGKKEFNLLIKGDVQGSVEAIGGALKKLGTDEVEARIVHSGVGGITESDIALAAASKAVVIGFNVRANAQAKQAADAAGIEIRYYNIIYDLLDDVKAAMSGLLAPTIREVFLGNAEVLQVFNISKVGKVAGCRVTEGKVMRGGKVRLIRDNVVIHEGTLSVLKRFKDDVKEVPVGQECGMSFANYQDLRDGDVIECFNVETVTRSL